MFHWNFSFPDMVNFQHAVLPIISKDGRVPENCISRIYFSYLPAGVSTWKVVLPVSDYHWRFFFFLITEFRADFWNSAMETGEEYHDVNWIEVYHKHRLLWIFFFIQRTFLRLFSWFQVWFLWRMLKKIRECKCLEIFYWSFRLSTPHSAHWESGMCFTTVWTITTICLVHLSDS